MSKKRQYRSNQGRSPKQTENNYKIMEWSLVGLFITLVATIIYGLVTNG